jgi:cytochrome c-type biogenesis protein CcmF
MVIHPPMLYLGYVGFVIPFSFAFAALATGQLGSSWIRATRAWALVAWMFLSCGLLLGGRWAYDVLGWGGYWGWDPVENAALLPWLTGTAFLHSAVVQDKRGMLKFWNMLLIIMTFLLVILGTFATRSGVVSSVHAFAESQVGRPMFTFLALSMLTSVILLAWRQQRGDLRGADELDSLLSRESLFLLNNWLFLALTVVVLWGTWAEAITTIAADLGLRDTVINLGKDYYPPAVTPLLILIYILMGVAPLAAWRKATAARLGQAIRIPILVGLGVVVLAYLMNLNWDWLWVSARAHFPESRFWHITGDELWRTFREVIFAALGFGLVAFAGTATLTEIWKGVEARHRRGENYWPAFSTLVARDRHRYGGYFIHLGMVVLGIGVIGSTAFQDTTVHTMTPGDNQVKLGPYTLVHNNLTEAQSSDGRDMIIAHASVYRGDKLVDEIRPRRDIFYRWDPSQQKYVAATNMSIAGTHSTMEGDFYAIIRLEDDQLVYSVYWNPLINFVWYGGIILVLGTLVALWPSRQPELATESTLKRQGAELEGARAGGGR